MSEVRVFLESLAVKLEKNKNEVDRFIKMYLLSTFWLNKPFRLDENWYTTKQTLLFLKKEDFHSLGIPKGLADLMYYELHKGEDFSFLCFLSIK